MKYKQIKHLRIADDNYWDYLFSISVTAKLTTPLIIFPGGNYKAFYYSQDLFTNEELKKFPEDTLIIHAWPGKWSTDIFAYPISSFKKEFTKYLIKKL